MEDGQLVRGRGLNEQRRGARCQRATAIGSRRRVALLLLTSVPRLRLSVMMVPVLGGARRGLRRSMRRAHGVRRHKAEVEHQQHRDRAKHPFHRPKTNPNTNTVPATFMATAQAVIARWSSRSTTPILDFSRAWRHTESHDYSRSLLRRSWTHRRPGVRPRRADAR